MDLDETPFPMKAGDSEPVPAAGKNKAGILSKLFARGPRTGEWVAPGDEDWKAPKAGAVDPLGWPAPELEVGQIADFTLLDLDTVHSVDPKTFKSKAKFSPWTGQELRGWPVLTVVGGQVAFRRE